MSDHGHGHDGHGHNPNLAHHFDTIGQQIGAAKLGMWLFLATEILMFSGLFLAYFILRLFYPEMVLEAHEQLSKVHGGINTCVLLLSSFTMAMAVRAAQTNKMKGWGLQSFNFNIWATIACACIFMVIKYFEYSAKIHHGLLPGKFYAPHDIHIEGLPHIFFAIYFCMTGLHGIHVLIGIGVIIWIWTMRGRFSPEYYVPVENVGLYWHIVDLIWIFLFPLLYLVR